MKLSLEDLGTFPQVSKQISQLSFCSGYAALSWCEIKATLSAATQIVLTAYSAALRDINSTRIKRLTNAEQYER